MSLFRKTTEEAIIPKRGTKASAGHDFCALEGGCIKPNQRLHIKTGIGWSELMNEALYGHLKERSGHASKFGILLLAGVIDADYTDDIVVILLNTGEVDFNFKAGDKIAQMMVLPYAHSVEEELVDGIRIGGFGSTDKPKGIIPSEKGREPLFPDNLCDFCVNSFATCKSNPKFATTGDGVIECNEHREPF